jgi:hypothetical protein
VADTHPVVQAAAEALAKEFAGGRQDGGLYRHFIADDGYGSFCSASPSEAAAVAAPAVLRHMAAELISDDGPTGHDDLCSYGPPGECDCCTGEHYRWLMRAAAEIESGRVEGHTGSQQ